MSLLTKWEGCRVLFAFMYSRGSVEMFSNNNLRDISPSMTKIDFLSVAGLNTRHLLLHNTLHQVVTG